MSKDIWCEIVKEWGGFQVGEVVRFGRTKGERLIESGYLRKVKKQAAVNDRKPEPKQPPKVETAIAPPAAENAMASPVPKEKPSPPPEEKKADKKK